MMFSTRCVSKVGYYIKEKEKMGQPSVHIRLSSRQFSPLEKHPVWTTIILRLSQNHEFPLRTDFGKISDTVLKENAVSSHNPHPSNHTPKMTLLAQRIDHGPPAAPVGPYLISLSSAVLPSTSGTPQRAPSPFPPDTRKEGRQSRC